MVISFPSTGHMLKVATFNSNSTVVSNLKYSFTFTFDVIFVVLQVEFYSSAIKCAEGTNLVPPFPHATVRRETLFILWRVFCGCDIRMRSQF